MTTASGMCRVLVGVMALAVVVAAMLAYGGLPVPWHALGFALLGALGYVAANATTMMSIKAPRLPTLAPRCPATYCPP